MGLRKLSARLRHHAKDEEAAAAFKKNSRRFVAETVREHFCRATAERRPLPKTLYMYQTVLRALTGSSRKGRSTVIVR
jgi:hypothetical protein